MDVVILEGVDFLEVSINGVSLVTSSDAAEEKRQDGPVGLQFSARPLYFLYHIKSRVNDELVHLPSFVSKARVAISASFRRPKFDLKERIIPCADDGEVVRHLKYPARYQEETNSRDTTVSERRMHMRVEVVVLLRVTTTLKLYLGSSAANAHLVSQTATALLHSMYTQQS